MVAKGRFHFRATILVDFYTMTRILVAVTGFAGNGGCANKRLCSLVVLVSCNDLSGWARHHTRR